MVNLGSSYADGTGVKLNHKKAVKYFRMAADRNHALAQIKPPVTDTNHIVHLCRGVSLRMAQAAGVSAHDDLQDRIIEETRSCLQTA